MAQANRQLYEERLILFSVYEFLAKRGANTPLQRGIATTGMCGWRVGRWWLLQIYWTSLMLATKRKRQSLLYSTIKIFTIDITQAYVFQNETWPRRSNHLHLHRPEWHPGKWMVIPWGESRLNRNNKTHTDIRQLIVPPKKWLKKLCIDRWQIGIFV